MSGKTADALTPTMPIILDAAARNTTTIRVTWNPGAGGSTITKFRVYRAGSGQVYSQIGGDRDPMSPSNYYDDTTVPPGDTKWYKVSAFDGTLESPQSPSKSATTGEETGTDHFISSGTSSFPAGTVQPGSTITLNRAIAAHSPSAA